MADVPAVTAFAAPEAPADEGLVTGGSGTIDTQPQVRELAYDGHADLKDFAVADGEGWRYDTDKLAKVLNDRRAHITRQDELIKGLREANGQEGVPERVDAYLEGLDREGLKAKAGRAYLGRAEGQTNPAEDAFFNAMLDAGVPVGKARQAFERYLVGMHEAIPEPEGKDARLSKAVSHLGPNGRQQLEDVNAWLGARHKASAFTEDEQGILDELMHTGPGLSALWRISRAGASSAPPSMDGVDAAKPQVMAESEIHAAMRSDRYRTDDAYRAEVMRSYEALHKVPDTGGARRTLHLGA